MIVLSRPTTVNVVYAAVTQHGVCGCEHAGGDHRKREILFCFHRLTTCSLQSKALIDHMKGSLAMPGPVESAGH